MRTVTIKDPHYSTPDNKHIDATVTINGGPEWPYTFSPLDYSGLGAEFFPRIESGEFGPVLPYTPPAEA